MFLAPNLGKILETIVLIMNAAAILNEKYFLRKCKLVELWFEESLPEKFIIV